MSRQIDDLCILNRDCLFRSFPRLGDRACAGNHPPRPYRIAIIGNGPVSDEDAALVANCDMYVRFNNWGSRACLQPHLKVVGGRCDVVFGNMDIHTTNQGASGVGVPRLAVQAIPYPHRYNDADMLASKWYPTAQLAMINPFWMRDLCYEMGLDSIGVKHPLPTVGITGMYAFWRMGFDTAHAHVEYRVAGFNWHYDRDRGTYDGLHPSVVDSPPKGRNHYYLLEARWCSEVLLGSKKWLFTSAATEALQNLL